MEFKQTRTQTAQELASQGIYIPGAVYELHYNYDLPDWTMVMFAETGFEQYDFVQLVDGNRFYSGLEGKVDTSFDRADILTPFGVRTVKFVKVDVKKDYSSFVRAVFVRFHV